MSTELKQTAVSSMSSIISSIENDRQVCRWFLIFISLPEIQQLLSKQNKTSNEYRTLKGIQTAKIITYLTLALIIAVFCLVTHPWVLLLEIIPIGVLINLTQQNSRCVAAISKQFLLENTQPDELSKQTLYQICEFFSQKYSAPSLVDIITFQDTIGRKILMGSIFIVPFIYPLKAWQIFAVIFSVFFATRAIVNTSIVLRKLK